MRVPIDPQFEFVSNFKADEFRDEKGNEASNDVPHSNISINGGE